jgi:uncharacterized membrane protein
MSATSGDAQRNRAATTSAKRRVVASYDSYSDAERAVDFLSDEGFPVERLAIVGTGVRLVEQVSGRVTSGRAALLGAGQGAMIGLLFALLIGLFFTVAGAFIGVLLYGLAVGAIFGALFGFLTHYAQGGRRDFASVSGMQAERYEVQVEEEVADRASETLARLPARTRG